MECFFATLTVYICLGGEGGLANLVSFRDLLKLLSCLLPDLNEPPGRMESILPCFTFLETNTLCPTELPSKVEVLSLRLLHNRLGEERNTNQRNSGARALAMGKRLPAAAFWKVWLAFQRVEEVCVQRPLQPALFLCCLRVSQANQSRAVSCAATVPCGGGGVVC